MKPFEYVRAGTIEEAVSQRKGPNSYYLGGGTNLVDLVKYGVEIPDRLVDITHLPLDKIELLRDGSLRIGAMVRNSDLGGDHRVAANFPVLSQAILNGASPQLRNMATTGGNLLQRTRCYYFYDTAFPCNKRKPGSGCSAIEGVNRIHAILGQSENCIAVHPSDMAVAMAALDATITVVGPKGRRSIPILEFHRLPGDTPEKDTNLGEGELIVGVDIPASASSRNSSYLKIRDRNSYAFALVSVAAGLEISAGMIRYARLAMGGVAHKPWRALETEQFLIGKQVSEETFKRASELALKGAKGYEHNEFKIELAKRAIVRSFGDLAGGIA